MDLKTVIEKRRSCRAYLDKEVPEEQIRECVNAARMAPSACNKQPWRFIAVRNANLRKRICREAILPGIKMNWLEQVPVLVVICLKKKLLTHILAPLLSGIPYEYIDIGIAGEHFVLAAEERGLGTCWIGWINAVKIRKILNLPLNETPVALISLGYPAAEPEPCSRLELDDILEIR